MTTAEFRNAARRIAWKKDGLCFTRYFFFQQPDGSKMIVAPHPQVIQKTPDRMIDRDSRQRIINVPPGYTRTEMATINTMEYDCLNEINAMSVWLLPGKWL